MNGRFDDLKKFPKEPAQRLLAGAGMSLKTPVEAPASAGVPEVLAELESKEAWVDMMLLVACALPPREAVWWACLSARDVLGDAPPSPCLKAAEAWVFEPKEPVREKLFVVLQNAPMTDPAIPCASAALYGPGTMGPGELAEHPAPPSALPGSVFSMNIEAIKGRKDPMGHLRHLIERGLDIARGGNGKMSGGEASEIAATQDEGAN